MPAKPRRALTIDLDRIELTTIHGGLQLLAQYRGVGEPLRTSAENTLARLTSIIVHTDLFDQEQKQELAAHTSRIIQRNHSAIIRP